MTCRKEVEGVSKKLQRDTGGAFCAVVHNNNPIKTSGEQFGNYRPSRNKSAALSHEAARRVNAQPKMCYKNAAIALFSYEGACYIEGVMTVDNFGGLPVEHAWVELDSGIIIDPTLPDDEGSYFPFIRYTSGEVLELSRQEKLPFYNKQATNKEYKEFWEYVMEERG